MKRVLLAAAALALVVASSLTFASTAQAHEQRNVGKYKVAAGWNVEPAIVDRPNAVFFEVVEAATGREVEGLEKTVTVEVTYGGQRATFAPALHAVLNEPGSYTADITPTAAGDYTFHFTGKIEDLTLDEKFESGPGRFDSIDAGTDLQFPQKAASAAELTLQLADLRFAVDQTRIIAIVAVAIGLVGVRFALRRRA